MRFLFSLYFQYFSVFFIIFFILSFYSRFADSFHFSFQFAFPPTTTLCICAHFVNLRPLCAFMAIFVTRIVDCISSRNAKISIFYCFIASKQKGKELSRGDRSSHKNKSHPTLHVGEGKRRKG